MRRLILAVAIATAAVFAVVPASAQVRFQGYGTPRIRMKAPPVIPIIRVIPPSMAVNRALAYAPRAKPLGVRLKGPLYIVKLKQGNTVLQVRVNAATGDVSP
jgi:hypothetical protein